MSAEGAALFAHVMNGPWVYVPPCTRRLALSLFLGMHLPRRQDLSRRLPPMDHSGEKPPIIDELPAYMARSESTLEKRMGTGFWIMGVFTSHLICCALST
jgi:hypothetical protein